MAKDADKNEQGPCTLLMSCYHFIMGENRAARRIVPSAAGADLRAVHVLSLAAVKRRNHQTRSERTDSCVAFNQPLPIDGVLDQLVFTVRSRETTVLVAPPGAGKSTRVPLAFLGEQWLAGRKIVLLEPRRVAARAVARRLSAELGEPVGHTVGYRMQGDTRIGPGTRVEVVTEGVLTRMLLADPLLSDTGLVIFDEFHERSLHADTGLALCLHSRRLLDAEFRLLIMSATLEAEQLAEKLDAGVVTSEGKAFPVQVVHRDKPVQGDDWLGALAGTVKRAFIEQEGDVLVFLPGWREIRRAMDLLESVRHEADLVPLHGGLPPEEQDRALKPVPGGRRRIILSTPVAETGLTVEGVRVVVDSGFVRVSRFSPRTGMNRLETVRISRASATQRQGRAGRTAPGACYRLWTEEEHRRLDEQRMPEIVETDLAHLVLTLKQWGAEPDELFWLTPPPPAHYRQAEESLRGLGLLAENGTLSEAGRAAALAGIHPRLACMIIEARRVGLGRIACRLAALLEERQSRLPGAEHQADIRPLLDGSASRRGMNGPDNGLSGQIDKETARLCRLFGVEGDSAGRTGGHADGPARRKESGRTAADPYEACGLLLSFAYPDRIAKNRGNGTFLLSNGRGAAFRPGEPLSGETWIVVADMDDAGANGLIHLAAPIREQQLLEGHKARLETVKTVEWSNAEQRIVARVETRLGRLSLKSVQDPSPDPERVKAVMLSVIRGKGLGVLPWTRKAVQLRERIAAMAALSDSWPDVSDDKLLMNLNDWLGEELADCRSLQDVERIPLHEALLRLLTWEQRMRLDQLVPTHLTMPSGSRIPVDYGDPEAPFVAVRLQEVFGLKETPRLADGRLPVVFRLLSPAGRPVQITRDLAGFWRTTYFEVRKELKGRYPKHEWPEDPLSAKPTNRVRPRGSGGN
jgi:ATP-dependent helicase HrpB